MAAPTLIGPARHVVHKTLPSRLRAHLANRRARPLVASVSTIATRIILQWPRTLLLFLLVLLGGLAMQLPHIVVDVSARTLLRADNPDLQGWRETSDVFHLPATVTVTVEAPGGLPHPDTRTLLEQLTHEIAALPGVNKVTSVLDVPLLQQVRGPLMQIDKNRRSLRSPGVDFATASTELAHSPLFGGVLLSADGRISTLLVELRSPPSSARLGDKQAAPSAPSAHRAATIAALHSVLARYRKHAQIGLIGAPVVAEEIARTVSSDLLRLPALMLLVMTALIAAGTRRPPILEIACASAAVIAAAGLWQLTYGVFGVTPAAVLPLVVVIAVSLAFTLRVSYKLHVSLSKADDPHAVLAATVDHALSASFPAGGVLLLLGMVLSLSPLLPVHELGGMLLCGLVCAWLAAFGIGPCLLAVMQRRPQALSPVPVGVPARWLSVMLACALAVAAIDGLPRFIQPSSIADYLPIRSATRDTLALIERAFGGALSFDVVLTLPATAVRTTPPIAGVDDLYRSDAADTHNNDEWFTSARVKLIARVHHWMEGQNGVGRVLSLASLLEVGQQLNDGVPLSPFELNVMYKRLPRAVRASLIDPYLQLAHDQARIHIRLRDLPTAKSRVAWLAALEAGLQKNFGLTARDYRLSGPYVVYAHMADLLAPTLVVVSALAALASLALVILSGRTPRAASRMLTPTLIAALGVMGVAGWHSLRLDVMTVCASAVAFALFVQIRTAGRRLIETPTAAALQDGSAPPPVQDPYGSTVIGLGTISVCAGLAVMGTAAFTPTAHFGVLCGATVLLALLASQRVSGLRRRFD